jgi:hypothetical protein
MPKGQQVVGLDACATTQVDDQRVAAMRPLLVTAQEAAGIADVFDLLSDPSRVRVLFALLEAARQLSEGKHGFPRRRSDNSPVDLTSITTKV